MWGWKGKGKLPQGQQEAVSLIKEFIRKGRARGAAAAQIYC